MRRSLQRPLLVTLLWTLMGWLAAGQVYFLWKAAVPHFYQALAWQLPPYLAWLLATPLVAALVRRFPIERRRFVGPLLLHGLASVTIGFCFVALSIATGRLIGVPSYMRSGFLVQTLSLLGKLLDSQLILYGAVAAFFHLDALRRKVQERELAAHALAERLAQAQLAALKRQIHPHFLFNTLHAIGVLVRKQETQGALRMLSGLSALLRMALEDDDRQVVPLQEELKFLDRYLDIEKIRLGARLTVEQQVEPAALPALVPNLLLQPLVENAIRHGIAPRLRPGTVRLQAERRGDRLHLVLTDDGLGLRPGWQEQEGTGLRNSRERLQRLYPHDHALRIEARDEGGVRIAIDLPFSLEAPHG